MRLIIMIIYDILLQASLPVQQPKPMLCDREEESCIRIIKQEALHGIHCMYNHTHGIS